MKKNKIKSNKEYKTYRVYKELKVPKIDKFGIMELLEKIDDILDVHNLSVDAFNFLDRYSIEISGYDYFEEDMDGTDEFETTGETGRWIDEDEFDKQGKSIISIGWSDADEDYIRPDFNIIIQTIIDNKDVDEFIADFGLFAEKHFLSYKYDYKVEEIK